MGDADAFPGDPATARGWGAEVARRPGASSASRPGRASGRPGPEPPRGLGGSAPASAQTSSLGISVRGPAPGGPADARPFKRTEAPGSAPGRRACSRPRVAALVPGEGDGVPSFVFWGRAAERARSQFPGQGWNPRPWQEKPGVLAPGGRAVPAEGPPGARTGLLGAEKACTRHLLTDTDLARPPAGLGARGRPERLFPGPTLAAAALGGPRACPGRREEGGVVGDWGRCPGAQPASRRPRRRLPLHKRPPARLPPLLSDPGRPAGGSAGEEAAPGGRAGVERGQAN